MRIRQPKREYPQYVKDWLERIVRRIGAKSTSAHSADLYEDDLGKAPVPIVVPLGDEAARLLDEYEEFCMDMKDKYERYRLHHLFSRSSLMAEKYALIMQMSKDPYSKEIDAASTEWAIEWVKHHQQVFIDLYLNEAVSSPREKLIKDTKQAFGDSILSMAEIREVQAFKAMDTKQRRSALNDLVSDGILVQIAPEAGGKGRKAERYKLLEHATIAEMEAIEAWLLSKSK